MIIAFLKWFRFYILLTSINENERLSLYPMNGIINKLRNQGEARGRVRKLLYMRHVSNWTRKAV